MSETDPATVHLNPYRDTALDYRAHWFKGVLPLPYKEKHPPPTGFTGHRADYPDTEQINEWREDGRHNIGVRLAGVDAKHELIGIDVDHYRKGERDKKGGEQLAELENQLGPLPPTWISSARTDGVSGIRYFRVPRGLAFRGQVEKDVECISKGYRFAVVWPSIHPDGGTYWWFPPGMPPSGDARRAWDGSLPVAREFPVLPEAWIDYLTQGKMRSADDDRIDMDSSVDDIYAWADATFHGNADTAPCPYMQSKLDRHLGLIEDEATSHDKLVNGHFNLMLNAQEGHVGWNTAINELESHFRDTTLARGKRTMSEVREEIFRSRVNALRKIKAKCDERVKIGAAPVDGQCDKMGGLCAVTLAGADPDDPISTVPKGGLKPVDEYEMNDDGNAQHFVDMFSSTSIGPSIRWADGYGWLIWHDGDNPHWEVDINGDQTMRRMWQRVKQRQLAYVDALWADYQNQLQQWIGGGAGGAMPANVKAAKAKHDKWNRFAELSGNNRNAENALKAVKSQPFVTIDVNELDQNPYLLGVSNGVVELDGESIMLRRASATDLITLNTGTSLEPPSTLGADTWEDYLTTFLPDDELRRNAQVALGHCLIGGNPEKIMIVLKGAPNTGKSTMVNAIETALGDYASSVNQSIFQNHKLNPVLAQSIAKRAIVISEFDEKDQLSASVVKRITGGTDKIQAELKGSNITVEGIPQFVPILATNEVPTISGADKALQNRLYVIPFNVTPNKIRKEFSNVIKNVCGTAILGWLINGYVEYRRLGEIPVSVAVREETASFVAELDEVATFASEALKRHSNIDKNVRWEDVTDWCVTRVAMYTHFQRWWNENNYQSNKIPNMHMLTRRLKALGYPGSPDSKRINGEVARWWYGVKIVSPRSNVLPMPTMSSFQSGTD
jgi:P4 family phage/plasmid primase-like protien